VYLGKSRVELESSSQLRELCNFIGSGPSINKTSCPQLVEFQLFILIWMVI